MLKKSLRLRKKEDFDRVFRNGRVIFSGGVTCRFLSKPTGSFRLGFSVSKKHLPKAVDRNRFRRVFSALVEEKSELWPKNTDVVFSLQRPIPKASKKDWAPTVSRFLKEIGTITKN